MSGIRVSNVFAFEDSFCSGKSADGSWIAPPPGSFISMSLSRGLNKLFTAGSKTLDTFAYGSLSGSWSWSFTLDYNYLEPLYLAFENVSSNKVQEGPSAVYEHVFDKTNAGRIPSFAIRRKQMNSIVGGKDETVIFKGCVCKSIKFSMQAGSSQINVSMSGAFADVELDTTALIETDYKEYTGNLPQFACMYIGDEAIADVDSLSVDIDNGAGMIYSTCTPIATRYMESQSNYSFSASAYSSDPAKFKQRMFSGGYDNSKTTPMRKGLKPIPTITIRTSSDDVSKIDSSTESVKFTIESCAVRAIEWQRGDGSKIMEQISGSDCKHIYLTIRNNIEAPKTHNAFSDPKKESEGEGAA